MTPSHAELFEDLDRMDGEAWVSHFAPDVLMQFANEDPVYGRAAGREVARRLFERVESLSHHELARWVHGDATVVETTVTFGLPEAAPVTLPMVTIFRVGPQGLIVDYRVYLDPSPLAPLVEP